MTKNASWPRASTAFRASPSACGSCSKLSDRSSTSQRSDATSESRRAAPHEAQAMNRRAFVTGLGAAFAMPGVGAEAQPATKASRLGIFSTGNPRSADIFQAFEQKLRELGYVDGQNLSIEFRNAEGRTERLPRIAAELAHLNLDVIVVATEPGTRAITQANPRIPIVLVSVNFDPVKLGFVRSLANPGTNITGVVFLHRELTAKRLQILKEMLPAIKRVAVLSDPIASEQLEAVEMANRSIGFTLQSLEVRNPSYDFEGAFRAAVRSRAEAVLVLTTPVIFRERSKVAQLALASRLPTSFAHREHVDAGGLMSYGPNFPDMWRLAASYVDKILKGAKPAALPLAQRTNFELVINIITAKALGLTIPPSLLLRADQVIE